MAVSEGLWRPSMSTGRLTAEERMFVTFRPIEGFPNGAYFVCDATGKRLGDAYADAVAAAGCLMLDAEKLLNLGIGQMRSYRELRP